ncbi:MAG: hypothetical protein LC742_02510, partial [Acidobacteria bacterium]|nr:hypothetical protein [Acidobacteriota bacterium]
MKRAHSHHRSKPNVLLSYGLGKHSTAAAVELIENPQRRDFDLDQLILVTAMTGDEWESTRKQVTAHLLPILRHYRVRYVQIARNGPRESDGIRVLSDTDQPDEVFTEGVYKLSTEMLTSGVVPSLCGTRKCSLKMKGWVINQWIERALDRSSLRQIIGFHAGEGYRVEREQRFYTGETAPIERPLIKWGWDNEACLDYLRGRFGVEWKNSACDFCMFAGGKPEVIARFREEPVSGAKAVVIERTARAINPRITLYSRRSVEECLREDGNAEAIELADAELQKGSWTLMRVQRIRYAKTQVHRRTEELARGTKAEMDARLAAESLHRRIPLTYEGGHARLYILRAPEAAQYPNAEEMIVVAPGTVKSKCRANFTRRWHELVEQGHLFRAAAS